MPSTPNQPHKEGSPDVTPPQDETHAWAHFRALMSGKPCPVCDYDPSKDPVAVAVARLHAVFDDPVLRNLEWGVPPSDATDIEIRTAEMVRARAPSLKQSQAPMSEEQRAALEANAARREKEDLRELIKLINPGMSAERAREVDENVAEGRRIYFAAREHGRDHTVALRLANKDGSEKRWKKSQLSEYGKKWKSEWKAKRPK